MLTGQDAHGRPKNVVIDDDSGCLGSIDVDHIKIHEGESYEAMVRFSVPSGSIVYVYLETQGKEAHWKPSVIRPSADKLTVEFYENQTKLVPTALTYNTTTRLGGIPPRNNSRGSTKTSTVIMGTVVAPTVIGTPIASFYLPGSAGTGQTRNPSESQATNELDLKLNTAHLYKIINESTVTSIVELQFRWYEILEGV